jgi:hypothetical protein
MNSRRRMSCPQARPTSSTLLDRKGGLVHRSEVFLLMSVQGQNENPRLRGLCQLPPAADMPMHELMCEKCRVWATVLALAAPTPQVAE